MHYGRGSGARDSHRDGNRKHPDDTPYPSALLLGHAGTKAIHVVYADDAEEGVRIVITAYEPDPEIWNEDLKTRR